MSPTERTRERPNVGPMHGTYLGRVVSISDPDSHTRVQVRLYNAPSAVGDSDCAIWARVAVPFAGMLYVPDVDEEVVVVFVGGDPRQPLVLGSLWSGGRAAPDQFGGDRVDRYVVKGKKGSLLTIKEDVDGQATITVQTPATDVSIVLNEQGSIQIQAGSNSVTLDSSGVTVTADQSVSVTGSQVEVTASQVTVNSAMSTFSGMVTCETLQATTVIAATYTPGAGNVW
jgi:uncharacterized protein involved in type VI secretion and phage assembly